MIMPDPSPPSCAASIVKRACDCCHKRKVRCIGDGTRPCKNCTTAGLTCTYNAVPQKKGPKGSRAKVISELRETQRQSQLTVGPTLFGFENAQYAAAFARTPNILSMDVITSCVDYFFANMYPTQPILHRQKVGETIGQMDISIEAYCLVTSLCSYMLIQPNMTLSPGTILQADGTSYSTLAFGTTLLQETIRVRKACDYMESPTPWSAITSFFLFGSYFCLDKHNTAWFHLREATTLALVMDMDEEESYKMADVIESSRRRRLYWLLFVTERAYALQRHRPLSLQGTINLPLLDEDPAETVELSGFIHLVNLFKPFDDTFVGLWNKAKLGCSVEWVSELQSQLSEALPAYLHSTEAQAVDLRVSQQWLKTMVWQLSISHGYLSSVTSDSPMSFRYPIEISRDMLAAAGGFTQMAMEIHGIGLIEKLFDVACTLVDVMAFVPCEQYTFEYGPRDYLNQYLNLISTLRGGKQRYLPLLLTKINDTMPSMPTPGFTLTSAPSSRSGRFDDLYDEHSSAPNSSGSTPFGSPPSGNVVPLLAQPPFHHFEGLGVGSATLAHGYPFATASTPVVCLSAPMSAPQMYSDAVANAYSGVNTGGLWDVKPMVE